MGRSRHCAAACAAAVLLPFTAGTDAHTEQAPRIDLRVLVVDDGGEPVAAIADQLRSAGTPYTAVRLRDEGRPRIDAAFLSGTADGRPLARYQAVVLPEARPAGVAPAETAALAAYERRFGIRQVDAYATPGPGTGLGAPRYSGSLDGRTARVTPAGRAGPFGYLAGRVPFEDRSPDAAESHGHLAEPGPDFTTYVDAPVPGGGRGALVGEYAHDGRRELVATFGYQRHQLQYRLLARGIVEWATGGVHLGADRNYLAVHVDDVFGKDARWDSERDCTTGAEGCGAVDPIRMTPADAAYAKSWSARRGLTLDMVYNGGGSELHKAENGGDDPLADRLTADRSAFRWVNHTLDHTQLGCLAPAAPPRRCDQWAPEDYITRQITANRAWARDRRLPLAGGELVTGEHSGLAVPPEQPDDNPNLAPALTAASVRWLASDSSREPRQRRLGPALTVPRYPMNVFYNAGREAEQVDEYNWIYARRADGGTCEGDACLDAPLDPGTGYRAYIVPLEASTALGHITANDPRPHYIHQSNLAEDRLAYPALDRILDDYRGLYAAGAPLVGLRQAAIGRELERRAAWAAAVRAGEVTGYRIGRTVTIQTPAGVCATATVPPGTRQQLAEGAEEFGSPYAGRASGWTGPDAGQDHTTLITARP